MRDGFRTRVLDLESILLSYELRQAQGDPFDRLLHAQAVQHGCRLMTLNRALPSFGTSVFKPQQTKMTFAYLAIGQTTLPTKPVAQKPQSSPKSPHKSHKNLASAQPFGTILSSPSFQSGVVIWWC